MKKYLLQIEFRYNSNLSFRSKVITVGIYNEFDLACQRGNNVLENLEKKFPLHIFPSGREADKQRFTKNGLYDRPITLITDLAYLKTPFQFFVQITTLEQLNLDLTITQILNEVTK